MNWRHGTLVTPPTPPEPEGLGEDDSIAALLDEAEDIVNAAGPRVMAEVAEDQGRSSSGWRRFLPGRRRPK